MSSIKAVSHLSSRALAIVFFLSFTIASAEPKEPPPPAREPAGVFVEGTSGDKIEIKKKGSGYTCTYRLAKTDKAFELEMQPREKAGIQLRDHNLKTFFLSDPKLMKVMHSKRFDGDFVDEGLSIKWIDSSLPEIKDHEFMFKRTP